MSLIPILISTLLLGVASSSEHDSYSTFAASLDVSQLTCGGDVLDRLPFCFPANYSRLHRPNDPDMLEVWADLELREISSVDDLERTITLSIYLTLSWVENRIELTSNPRVWNKTAQEDYVMNIEEIRHFWIPDLEVHGLRSFLRPSSVRPVGGLLLDASRRVWYTVSAFARVECPFDFADYPADAQNCSLRMGSFFHETESVRFAGSFSYNASRQRDLPYEFGVVDLPAGEELAYYKQGTEEEEVYSVYGFQIKMRREFSPFVFKFYVPSAIFVLVSWVSFTIDPRVVPGRMALLVTLLLMLINMSTGLTTNIPVSKHLTAIEVWVFCCIGFVGLSLAEYSLLLLHLRAANSTTPPVEPMKSRKIKKNPMPSDLFAPNYEVMAQKSGMAKKSPQHPLMVDYYRRVDTAALIVFAVSFALFNLIYWRVYTFRHAAF